MIVIMVIDVSGVKPITYPVYYRYKDTIRLLKMFFDKVDITFKVTVW